jgi:hypothetical protein
MTNRVRSSIIVAALLVGGCGGSANHKPASSGSPAATASKAPYGLYVRTVTKRDIARTAGRRDEHGPDQSTPAMGRYRLVIAKGAAQDVIKVTDPTGFTIDMDVTADGDSLRLTSYVDPSRASFCGPEIPAPTSYSFQAASTSLQLRPKADPCADRDSMLTGTWAKS